MPMSGAGQIKKSAKPPGRMIKRELRSVGPDYEQDIIEYNEGFLAQYGAKVVLSWGGFIACVALWLFASSPYARDADVWGMMPTLWFLTFLTPVFFVLPFWWMWTYWRMLSIFTEDDPPLISDSSVEETTS